MCNVFSHCLRPSSAIVSSTNFKHWTDYMNRYQLVCQIYPWVLMTWSKIRHQFLQFSDPNNGCSVVMPHHSTTQSGAVITWSNITRYYYCSDWGGVQMRVWIHKIHPISRLSAMQWGVFYEDTTVLTSFFVCLCYFLWKRFSLKLSSILPSCQSIKPYKEIKYVLYHCLKRPRLFPIFHCNSCFLPL